MPKFYVCSGAFRQVVEAPDSYAAVAAAIKKGLSETESITLDAVALVSEKGFPALRNGDEAYSVDSVNCDFGLYDKYPITWDGEDDHN